MGRACTVVEWTKHLTSFLTGSQTKAYYASWKMVASEVNNSSD